MGLYDRYILPRILDFAMRNGSIAPYRARTAHPASGTVLEVGIGSALNLPHYSRQVTRVIGLEPHPKLASMAAFKKSAVPVEIVSGLAESIPIRRASVDTVLLTWTLCSIPDTDAALREIRRVLKPGGRLLFVEHGLAPEPDVQRWQHRLTPFWSKIAGGCHLDRDAPALIREAGFEIEHVKTSRIPGPRPMTFMYEGSAIRQ
jgi:ubiquinone/menaquinone biosynthesis C-methylase UbiE